MGDGEFHQLFDMLTKLVSSKQPWSRSKITTLPLILVSCVFDFHIVPAICIYNCTSVFLSEFDTPAKALAILKNYLVPVLHCLLKLPKPRNHWVRNARIFARRFLPLVNRRVEKAMAIVHFSSPLHDDLAYMEARWAHFLRARYHDLANMTRPVDFRVFRERRRTRTKCFFQNGGRSSSSWRTGSGMHSA